LVEDPPPSAVDKKKSVRSTSSWKDKVEIVVFSAGIFAVLVWFPPWTIGAAFASAMYFGFFGIEAIEKTDTTSVFDLLASGVFFFGIELLDWLVRYRNDVPFRDVMFPTTETPADLRTIFIGWLLVFSAMSKKIRSILNDAPKFDD
jgi:hypothetical protein